MGTEPNIGVEGGVGPSRSAPPAPPTRDGWLAGSSRAVSDYLARYGVLVVLLAMIATFCIAMPHTFATSRNFQSMVGSQAVVVLLAGAATIVLRVGDFDLSIASVMVFSGALVAVLVGEHGWSPGAALVVAVGAGVVIGLVNAVLVVRVGTDAFITTLATLTVLTGLTYWISDSQVIGSLPASLTDISRTKFLGLQAIVWYSWILIGLLWYLYERTPLGRYQLFVGGNPDTARLAGIRVDAIRMGMFILSSTVAALIGFFFVAQIGAMDPSISGQFLLQPFAAAFLGATTIKVGRFNALGTLVAVYLLIVGITGLQLLGAAQWVTNVFNGGALLLAVTVSRLAARRLD